MASGRLGGVLLRIRGAREGGGARLVFVPVDAAVAVVQTPEITPVIGASAPVLGLGAALGGVLPIVALGPLARAEPSLPDAAEGLGRAMLVCDGQGGRLGVVAEIVKCGWFEVDEEEPAAVRHEGVLALPLDLGVLADEIHASPWAGRSLG